MISYFWYYISFRYSITINWRGNILKYNVNKMALLLQKKQITTHYSRDVMLIIYIAFLIALSISLYKKLKAMWWQWSGKMTGLQFILTERTHQTLILKILLENLLLTGPNTMGIHSGNRKRIKYNFRLKEFREGANQFLKLKIKNASEKNWIRSQDNNRVAFYLRNGLERCYSVNKNLRFIRNLRTQQNHLTFFWLS